MSKIMKITISVSSDPCENVSTRFQTQGLALAQVRPALDRAIRALQAERDALKDCPLHDRMPG